MLIRNKVYDVLKKVIVGVKRYIKVSWSTIYGILSDILLILVVLSAFSSEWGKVVAYSVISLVVSDTHMNMVTTRRLNSLIKELEKKEE